MSIAEMLPGALMISKARAMKRELKVSITLQCNFALLKTDDRCGEKNYQDRCDRGEEHFVACDEKLELLPRTGLFGACSEATLVSGYVGLEFLDAYVTIPGPKGHCLENDVHQRVRHRMIELLQRGSLA